YPHLTGRTLSDRDFFPFFRARFRRLARLELLKGADRMSARLTPDDFLARHRPALGLLARLQMPAWLRPKLDSSDLVQQTLLEAQRDRGRLAAMPESERAAYLRRCLCHNVIDAVRKFRPDQAWVSVEKSSARIESWLAAEDSTPSERSAREDQ